MYLQLHPRSSDDDNKPTSTFLISGVPAIIACIVLVASITACVIIRRKAKKRAEAEYANDAARGRESLDLELDDGPIYAQKGVPNANSHSSLGLQTRPLTSNMSPSHSISPDPSRQHLPNGYNPNANGMKREQVRPPHSRSTSVSVISSSLAPEDPYRIVDRESAVYSDVGDKEMAAGYKSGAPSHDLGKPAVVGDGPLKV